MNNTSIESVENNGIKKSESFLDFVQSLTIAIAICIFIYVLIVMPNQIDGHSMDPTLHHKEIILTNKLPRWFSNTSFSEALNMDYGRGDIIVFQKKPYDEFIKRIVGLPGEKLMIKDGIVYINDNKLNESYLPEGTTTKGGSFISEGEEVYIPQDSYVVMGDNRGNSHDSRSLDIGFVKEEWIKGKVLLKYWPLDQFKLLSQPTY